MFGGFYHGKRVLVTGHTGFKGSWLALWLKQMGAVVTGYALPPPTNPNLFEEARVAEGLRSVLGDVRDFASLKLALGESRAEVVFHLAAQPLVRASYQQPAETYATNVMGTVNLLEAVREAQGVRAVVNVTTDKCYENREWVDYLCDRIPLKRPGAPDDLAGPVVFLASEESRYVTGQTLLVDGGSHFL